MQSQIANHEFVCFRSFTDVTMAAITPVTRTSIMAMFHAVLLEFEKAGRGESVEVVAFRGMLAIADEGAFMTMDRLTQIKNAVEMLYAIPEPAPPAYADA